MSLAMPEVLRNYETLRKSWDSRSHAQCGKLLDELKLSIIQMALMPTEGKDVDQKVGLKPIVHHQSISQIFNFSIEHT